VEVRLGTQVVGSLAEGSRREWIATDGLGGYAMGTATGLATRRYHGLLIVAGDRPGDRRMGLFSLDPVLVVGDRRIELATHEWRSGEVAPRGHELLSGFDLTHGVPRYRWAVGGMILEAEVAMAAGRPVVGVRYRLVRSAGPVRLEVEALCTWRDVHGDRVAGDDPIVVVLDDGFVFEDAYRVSGPGFTASGTWYRGLYHREEEARGLDPLEDVFSAGRFAAVVEPGDEVGIVAWADDPGEVPMDAVSLVTATRSRYREVASAAGAVDDVDRALAWAADRFVVAGPTVVAGYPWFGDWSRDTMTAYPGLFLETGRADEGRALLERAAATVSDGMLANTADMGGTEYNTVDAAPWFLTTVARHVDATGDLDLADAVFDAMASIVDNHVAGTRYGIRVDDDGLITQGAPGYALTWMDARVDGRPITRRSGKPVEVNALWISGLAGMIRLGTRLGRPVGDLERLEAAARRSFLRRFPTGHGLHDVVDGAGGDDATLRPNQLLAASLPDAPSGDPGVVRACAPLLTPLGLRSLAPDDPGYVGIHRGDRETRDAAYHQGTVWAWPIGAYVEACVRTGVPADGVLAGLEAHLGEWGLGSVSETADGDPPHAATGCPFQAWSVAEVLRARRLLAGTRRVASSGT
jgi:predicted glycogen debranching enzyme